MAADAAAPSCLEAAQLTTKVGPCCHLLLARGGALAVHGEDVTLQAVVLGRGIVALVTKEAVPGAAMLRLPMPFHTSLPFGRELTLATFEKQTWKRLCYVLSMNYN